MKYKIALIGCGRISFKHIEGFVSLQDKLEFVAACDPNIERAKEKVKEYQNKTQEKFASAQTFTNYQEMLKKVQPDIVTIATESGNHKDIALACFLANTHVICEKPMALSTQDADDMIQAAKKSKKKLGVSYQNRFNPPIIKLREAVEAKRFGKILHGMIQIRWNRNNHYYDQAKWRGTWQQDGGTLMNQCTHGIDLLQWMMGEDAVRVQAQTRRFLRPIEAEDFGAAIVEFASGAVGIIEGSAAVYPKNLNETLSIFGQKGTAVIGGLAVNKIETWRFADSETVGDSEESILKLNEDDPPTVYGFGHSPLFANFIEAIEQNKEPAVTGEDAKKSMEIILAIYKSQKTGLPVDLPVDFSTIEMKDIW